MRISTTTPEQIAANPAFNLSAVAKTTRPQTNSHDTLNWLQSQENKQVNGFQHISVFVDKFSNVFVKDFDIYTKFLAHCINGSDNINQGGK